MKKRFEEILKELTQGVYEKDAEIGLSLLAAIAGESVLLLGPPGVAKSMVARRVKSAFGGGRSFEYLMSRFSTPDEIFGPVSISRLKMDDAYERNVDGFMPTADVVFLDEVWKAGPAILNTLLTIINEKVFRNGKDEMRVPMKLLIGASNELPADGEGLEALWDRFLVRIVSGCVRDEQNFYAILQEEEKGVMTPDVKIKKPITAKEYAAWQKEIAKIGIETDVLDVITFIRKQTKSLRLDDTVEVANRVHNIYISDRRWQHILHLLRASALIHERHKVAVYDLMVLVYCLWNDPDEIEPLRRLIVAGILLPFKKRIDTLKSKLSVESKRSAVRQALREIELNNDHRDDNKELFDGFYFRIDKYDKGNTYVFFVDYRNMKPFDKYNAPMEGVIYPDPHYPGRTVIRTMADAIGLNVNGIGAMRVKLYRDADNIYINGVKYPIHQLPEGMEQPRIKRPETTYPIETYVDTVENLSGGLFDLGARLTEENIFCSIDDKEEVQRQIKSLNHELAVARVDIQKLEFDQNQ